MRGPISRRPGAASAAAFRPAGVAASDAIGYQKDA